MHAASVTQPAIALTARHVPFAEIGRADWDRLFAATPGATPFSRWTFHRAWWDAYGTTAHDRYLLITSLATGEVRGIVPLMFRHEVEAEDLPTHTVVREHTPMCEILPGEAAAIMFGASYHADYATILAADDDINAVCMAAADSFCDSRDDDGFQRWDVVDLRRLREVDPVLPALESALASVGGTESWRVAREKEDVCPVVTVRGNTWDEYLATLDKTARHEIRRKMRRAEAIGELSIEISPPTPDAIADFVRLHDARFGERGLFPDNEGGARSRRFVERLAELELAEGDHGILHVARVRCGHQLVFVMLAFDDGATCWLYNSGMDPEAKNTSPGVTGAGLYLKNRIEAGRRRFDYLRGEERYKYEWGAVDEPIYRLLVTRSAA